MVVCVCARCSPSRAPFLEPSMMIDDDDFVSTPARAANDYFPRQLPLVLFSPSAKRCPPFFLRSAQNGTRGAGLCGCFCCFSLCRAHPTSFFCLAVTFLARVRIARAAASRSAPASAGGSICVLTRRVCVGGGVQAVSCLLVALRSSALVWPPPAFDYSLAVLPPPAHRITPPPPPRHDFYVAKMTATLHSERPTFCVGMSSPLGPNMKRT